MQPTDYTYANKLTELRLDISHPKNQKKVFLLLEGPSDVKFYRKLCNADLVKVEGVPGGKRKLEECLVELIAYCNRIIGIRDADFSHLEAKRPNSSNLFLTDVHDLEILIASCDEVFSSILSEYCDDDKRTHSKLKTKLLNAITFIGYCRWYNEINNLEYSFDSGGYMDLFNPKTMQFDEKMFVERLIQRSPNAKVKDVETILMEIQKLTDINHDYMQVCNGHDFMKVIASYISSKNGKGIGDQVISANFRIAFSFNHYKNTKLYRDTNFWASENLHAIYD